MPVCKHRHLDGDRSIVSIMPLLYSWTHNDFHLKTYPFQPSGLIGHDQRVSQWFLEGGLHTNLVDKFKVTTGVMQNPMTIFKAVENFVLVNGRKSFCGEFILAPQYHTFGDRFCPKGTLNERDVAKIVVAGIKEGERKLAEEGMPAVFKFWFGIGREVSPEEAVRLTRIMLEYDPSYVLGISLVCHEPSAPPEKFIEAFRIAKREGQRTACHVEWVKDRKESETDTPEKVRQNFQEDLPQLTKNLRTVIFDLEVDQIDHGFGLAENPELIKAVVDRNIVVTVCPGSLLTTHIIDDIRMLRIREMLDAGVRVCLDSDDDICMPDFYKVEQMYRDAYSRRYLDIESDLKQLAKNAESARFGNISRL